MLNRFVPALCVAVFLVALPRVGAASVTSREHVVAVKAATAPSQDPALSDPIWKTAATADGFEDFTTQRPSRFPTTAAILYDDKNIYVGFTCDQAGAPITATQSVNDVGYGVDDEVTFSVDTSGSNSRTYAFTATPVGVRYEYSSESSRYQPRWSALAKVTSTGYRVMMTIPIADMRVSGSTIQRWRINFSRRVAAAGDLLTWAYDAGSNAYCANNEQGATIYCDATRWPTLSDIKIAGVSKAPPPYADVYGLGSIGGDRKLFETTPLNFTNENPRIVGIDDLTVPVTRTLSFVGTVGPDFSNVESDQVTIAPQEFSQQYSEYRPFFAEGASFVSALPGVNVNGNRYQMFYTPSLGILDNGIKAEGTIGQNSIGLLSAKGAGYNDQAFGYGFSDPDGTYGGYLQGVDAHHPGLVDQTAGIGLTYQNLHSGIQPIVNYSREAGTLVGDPSAASALALSTLLSHGRWQVGAVYRDVGPEYAPIDGYTSLNDIRGPQSFVVYNGVGSSKGDIKSYSLSTVADRFVDRSGAAHQIDLDESASITFKNLLGFSIGNSVGELRTYADAYPRYVDPRNQSFNQRSASLNYRDGTPSPTDLSYSFGPFAVQCAGVLDVPLPCARAVNGFTSAYTQQLDLATTRTFRGGYGVTVEYGGTVERGFVGVDDSQWLKRLSITRAIGSDGQLALSLREIAGTGGFALPGENLALSFHQRFKNQNQLYVEYGSPASFSTVQRVVVKYVYHIGSGGAGS